MPLIKTAAITLNSRKWGDADRIVTFYTKEMGKIRGVARGARRMKSRLGASLEPLTICHLNLFEKSGDSLYRVSQADLVEPFMRFREDLTLMTAAARMVNVVGAVTPDGDPDPPALRDARTGLARISDEPGSGVDGVAVSNSAAGPYRVLPSDRSLCRLWQGPDDGRTAVLAPIRRPGLWRLCCAPSVPLFAALAREPGISSASVEAFFSGGRSSEGRRASSARGGKRD